MTCRKITTVCILSLALIACSDSGSKNSTEVKKDTSTSQSPAQRTLSPTQQAAVAAAKNLPKEGKVLEMMHAAGYTYMSVDAGTGKPLWIAASMMRIKPEQKIKWTDAAVMNNFTSKSLHRTFDQILFVSNAQVIE